MPTVHAVTEGRNSPVREQCVRNDVKFVELATYSADGKSALNVVVDFCALLLLKWTKWARKMFILTVGYFCELKEAESNEPSVKMTTIFKIFA